MKSYPLFFKIFAFLIVIPILTIQGTLAQTVSHDSQTKANVSHAEQDIIKLSKEKWQWMADRDMDALTDLFHEKSVFVHMGGTMSRQQELEVIKSGGIHYKKADIHEVSVNIIGNTAICLNKITLLAVVGGKEVTNPFVVTEVYVQENNEWKIASLSFTRLLGP